MFPRSSKYILFRLKAFLTFSAFLADIFTKDEKKLKNIKLNKMFQIIKKLSRIVSHTISDDAV